MTAAYIRSEKDFWTPVRRLFASRSPGRRPGRLPGGHIDDMVALRKAITLCGGCVRKFRAKPNGYVTKKNLPIVSGRCDGCSEHTERGHFFVHHTMAKLGLS